MERIRSVLALAAHPDDLELGCGATLAKLAARGVEVTAVILTDGGRGAASDHDRCTETRTALESLGVHRVAQHAFTDTRLHESLNELIATIEEHVRETKPDRVYTMFDGDRHQDHRAVYEASAVACRGVKQILGYETPSSYPNFIPTVFEPVDEFIERKVAALKMHTSQGSRLYMQEEKVRSAAHFRGVQVDLGQTEGFIPYKMVF
jgi:LmbE family N-acetylglucosaminyl deacetylase